MRNERPGSSPASATPRLRPPEQPLRQPQIGNRPEDHEDAGAQGEQSHETHHEASCSSRYRSCGTTVRPPRGPTA
jgi:hypothetical protein